MINQFAACPKCNQSNAEKVNFTWWGGVIGPKVINHVKCQNCQAKYNGKSGKDNTMNIVIYTVVLGVLGFTIFFVGAFLLAFLNHR